LRLFDFGGNPARQQCVTVYASCSGDVEQLQTAFETHRLAFFSTLATFVDSSAFARRQAALRQIDWVSYAKRPFGGINAAQVFVPNALTRERYSGYTHGLWRLARNGSLNVNRILVIPAKAGIQNPGAAAVALNPRFRGKACTFLVNLDSQAK